MSGLLSEAQKHNTTDPPFITPMNHVFASGGARCRPTPFSPSSFIHQHQTSPKIDKPL